MGNSSPFCAVVSQAVEFRGQDRLAGARQSAIPPAMGTPHPSCPSFLSQALVGCRAWAPGLLLGRGRYAGSGAGVGGAVARIWGQLACPLEGLLVRPGEGSMREWICQKNGGKASVRVFPGFCSTSS